MYIAINLIILSKSILHIKNGEGMTAYDYYVKNNHTILDEYYVSVLKGDITLADTKSAKKY